ncbi:hypothetical protein AB4Y88_18750 [Paenarthrobacter sp. RAF9]
MDWILPRFGDVAMRGEIERLVDDSRGADVLLRGLRIGERRQQGFAEAVGVNCTD